MNAGAPLHQDRVFYLFTYVCVTGPVTTYSPAVVVPVNVTTTVNLPRRATWSG
jgi:hypothetical protein